MRLPAIIRRVMSMPPDDAEVRLKEISEKADFVAHRLNEIAETPNPMTGEPDAFGALVHAMRGTYHRRRLEREGWTRIPE